MQTGCVATSPSQGFLGILGNIVQASLANLEVRLGVGSDKILYVYSKTEDMVHNGDVQATIGDMNDFYKSLIDVLPPQPDVFVRNESLVKQQAAGKRPCKISMDGGFANVVIVSDAGEINLPSGWVTMMPGEEIIMGHGERYKMKPLDWYS